MENQFRIANASVGQRASMMRGSIVSLLIGVISACVASPDFAGDDGTSEFPAVAARAPVALTPGDTILVKFLYWPELDQEQLIRPDGNISLQMVGHIDVAGLTVEALDARLHELYADKIKDPAITTIVTSYANRRAYVGGEVARPGYIALTDKMTALEAVMTAGGFETSSANVSDVVVIRHIEGERFAKLLDLGQPIAASNSDLLLAPRDIIYVPRTKIDEVNQWVDQYISRVIPAPVWTYAIYTER